MVTIPIRQSVTGVIKTFVVDTLPHVAEHAEHATLLSEGAVLAAKAIDKAGWVKIKDLGLGVTETKSQKEAMDEITEALQHNLGLTLFFVVASAGQTLPTAPASVAIGATTFGIDSSTVSACGDQVSRTKIAGFYFYDCPVSYPLGDLGPFPMAANISDPFGKPLTTGSIELVRKGTLGLGFECDVVQAANGKCQVPPGDYLMRARSPGFGPVTGSVTLPKGGGKVSATLQKLPIAKVTLNSQPGLTGFLAPGTQVKFTAAATDENGNIVPCDARFSVSNPVGSSVATINPTSGLLTVGPNDGAASVVARCGGVSSAPRLVSGTGERPVTSTVTVATTGPTATRVTPTSATKGPTSTGATGTCFDGTYAGTTTTKSPLGTTSGQGSFDVVNGKVSKGVFNGTVDCNGDFSGTFVLSPGSPPTTVTGKFSKTATFTLSGTRGSESVTMVLRKQ